MASTKEYLDFVMEQLSGMDEEYQDRPQIRIYDLRVVEPNEGNY